MPNPRLTASMLFALAQGQECKGNWYCHWCGSPCDDKITHDEPPPIPFIRSQSTAKRPAEPYICTGCILWRQNKTTVNFLGGGMKDGQTAKNHSWILTDRVALTLDGERLDKNGRSQDFDELWRFLIAPTKRFAIMLRDPLDKIDNLIQLSIANDPGGILANTPLYYTLNNIPHEYTLYELIESIKSRHEPSCPGVRVLWNFLGSPPEDIQRMYPKRKEENRGRGRPSPKEEKTDTVLSVVVDSGEQR